MSDRTLQVKNLYKMLLDLYNDQSTEITDGYLDKVELAFNLFRDLYTKPQLKGLDTLPDMIFDRSEQEDLIFGAQEEERVQINIGMLYSTAQYAAKFSMPGRRKLDPNAYTGNLNNLLKSDPKTFRYLKMLEYKDKFDKASFIETRNSILTTLLQTVAHENQHLLQYRFSQYQQKLLTDQQKSQLYSSLFQGKEQEIVNNLTSENTSADYEETFAYIDLFTKNDKAKLDIFQYLEDENIKNIFYLRSAHEEDARKASLKCMINFRKELREILHQESKLQEEKLLKNEINVYGIGDQKTFLHNIFQFNSCSVIQEFHNSKIADDYLDKLRQEASTLSGKDIAKAVQWALKTSKNADIERALYDSISLFKRGKYLQHVFRDEKESARLYKFFKKHHLYYLCDALDNLPFKEDEHYNA
ncbi:MAG: hypothetical protein J6A28_02090 [Clostridia bacterium]|nr:hypothetical protein [Clostridia bacterium]